MTPLPSCISHVSLGTNRFEEAAVFYDKVLSVFSYKRILSAPGAIGWGVVAPEFWVQTPIDGKKANVGNGTHVAFLAENKEQVHAFYEAALKAGATDDGEAGPRPQYGEPYYGCFVRDLDGHKIEATFWDMELAEKLGIKA